MREFQVGDCVELAKDSKFARQPARYGCENDGVITDIIEQEGIGKINIVKFDKNDHTNSLYFNYMDKDLVKQAVSKKETVSKSPKKADDKKKIIIEAIREDGVTKFMFEVDARITKMYEGQSTEIKPSGKWEGLKFYYIPSLLESSIYQHKLSEFGLFDDYGSTFYRDGRMNIAWLRTVGGKGTIIIDETIEFAQLSILIKKTMQFLKEYFEEYYKEFKIKGELTVEV